MIWLQRQKWFEENVSAFQESQIPDLIRRTSDLSLGNAERSSPLWSTTENKTLKASDISHVLLLC